MKLEMACPVCFVFDGKLIENAAAMYAFDTGAFRKRMFKHVFIEEIEVSDFEIGTNSEVTHKLVKHVFGTMEDYFNADVSKIAKVDELAEPGELLARAYLELITSPGRNEPDDRVCTIEVVFDQAISLHPHLRAVIVPHTLWDKDRKADWLFKLQEELGILVKAYAFYPGRHPQYYHALMESAVRDIYLEWGLL